MSKHYNYQLKYLISLFKKITQLKKIKIFVLGETWKRHRKAIKPTFSYQVIESHLDVFNEKLQILNNVLETQLEKTNFNVFPFIKNFIIDVLWG